MKTLMEGISAIATFWSYLLLTTAICNAADTFNTTQSIGVGDSLVSANGTFKLGFFNTSTQSKYLGIWFNKIPSQTFVWVANREHGLTNSSGVLHMNLQGILTLTDARGIRIWSSTLTSGRAPRNPVGQLLDSGNLIVKNEGDDNPANYLWQSFDYPSDTLLPEMKLGWIENFSRNLSSRKTPDDPTPGNFRCGMDLDGYPQMVVREGSSPHFRAGSWNGIRFTGTPQLDDQDRLVGYQFFPYGKDRYFTYKPRVSSTLWRFVIIHDGRLQLFSWNEEEKDWETYFTLPRDECGDYAFCGKNSICNISNTPHCSCLKGFKPKVENQWNMLGRANVCIRETPLNRLNCTGDGFRNYSGLKLPDTRSSSFSYNMTQVSCRTNCLKNCSCTAYAILDVKNGSGCLFWYTDLIDIKSFPEIGQDIYIRMAASEIARDEEMKANAARDEDMKAKAKIHWRKIILSSALSAGMLFLLGLTVLIYVWKKQRRKYRTKTIVLGRSTGDSSMKEDLELPLFDFATLASATDDFSITNKVGEGGFGPVFKGTLKDGQEIAVKRLSKYSDQGIDEFKTEVMHIAKLQHRNLVKLLGCCIESEEKMLIYEFMPNKSLNTFIFDQQRSKLIDWPKRYQIINGIARGLLYLHQDSRLRIIHRDLKAGNILLDIEMNPKISDFGVARSFCGTEIEANTNKVVGTYGYMSPEYAIDGLYSVKSDVFSFGVIVLEIVSGRRNRGFRHEDHLLNLLGHAWRLHQEGRSIELVDMSLRNSCNLFEAVRSIHIGLLCVQRSPEDRPSMSGVVFLLGGESALPEPKQPGFFTERNITELNSPSSYQDSGSANDLTFTLPTPR